MLPPSARAQLCALLRLSRAQMTTISGVTHLAASALSGGAAFSTARFARAWAFVLLAQFATHLLGEVYDLPSDALNVHATALTGGSRELVRGSVSPRAALRAALALVVAAAAALALVVPLPARRVGALILVLAVQYSAPPLLLNHRALGELDAALVTSVLVPVFSARAQTPVFDARRLAFLAVPPFFAKLALFLVLNQADRRPDWAAGKVTLPVLLGDRAVARLHRACMAAAYVSALCLAVPPLRARDWPTASVLLFLLPSAPAAFRISRRLRPMPYRLDALLPPALLHSTLLVWGVLCHALLLALPRAGLVNAPTLIAAPFFYLTLRSFLVARARANPSKLSDDVEAAAGTSTATAGGTGTNMGTGPSPPPAARETAQSAVPLRPDAPAPPAAPRVDTALRSDAGDVVRCDVVVAGAGVAGLVAAAALRRMGFSVVALERRPRGAAEAGADLALWPGAIAILRALGVPARFFDDACYPLDTVHMCNMDFDRVADGAASAAAAATVLKTIDMAAVTEGTGERFVLVARHRLMDVLRGLVPDDVIVYGANVLGVEESEETESVTLTYSVDGEAGPVTKSVRSRIAIGADGARSKLRAHVAPTQGGHDAIKYCGEVCYRGVLSLTQVEEGGMAIRDRVARLFPDGPGDNTMRINYGAGLRSSFGYMSADGELAYWWVKQMTPQVPAHAGKMRDCAWPEPLKTLHDVTPDAAFYMHAIEDGATLPKWSSNRVVLVGDAAHVVTPNMGQGACLATEDAFVFAAELAKHWKWPDGHVEAFYQYEFCRKPYAEAVAGESRKQLFLGQLSSRPMVALRELLLRVVPATVLQKTLKRNNFPVTSFIDTFKKACVTRL